jgi:hypothetical protein
VSLHPHRPPRPRAGDAPSATHSPSPRRTSCSFGPAAPTSPSQDQRRKPGGASDNCALRMRSAFTKTACAKAHAILRRDEPEAAAGAALARPLGAGRSRGAPHREAHPLQAPHRQPQLCVTPIIVEAPPPRRRGPTPPVGPPPPSMSQSLSQRGEPGRRRPAKSKIAGLRCVRPSGPSRAALAGAPYGPYAARRRGDRRVLTIALALHAPGSPWGAPPSIRRPPGAPRAPGRADRHVA